MAERIVPPLWTELEHAPTDKNHLERLLGGFACSRDVQCRVQNCYEDKHHMVFGQDLSEAEIEAKSAPFSTQAICRWKHQRVHVTWDRSQPIEGDDDE